MQPKPHQQRYTVVFGADRRETCPPHEIFAADDGEAVAVARRQNRKRTSFALKHGERTVHFEPAFEADTWSGEQLGEAHVAYLDLAAKVEQRKLDGQTVASVYRIYLRDQNRTVLSGRTIAVESDGDAIKVAAVLCHACAEVGATFELWKGDALLMVGGIASLSPTREELSRKSQQIVIDTEIALRDSRQALAESKHLLKTIDEWQNATPELFAVGSSRRRTQ